MARQRLQDFLQAGNFHILDVSFSFPLVLLPVFGFARCSLPTTTVDHYRFKEGNYEYPRHITKGAEIGPVVLEQGVSIFNSDFGDWMRKTIVGRIEPKDLLLVQFTRINASRKDGVVAFQSKGNAALPFEFVTRLPGRAWLLKECRPKTYKPGTDFDGMTQEISVASLELVVQEVTEFSLGI